MNHTSILETILQKTIRGIIRSFVRISFLYRIDKCNSIPSKGPALLVSNHVSFIDPLLIAAASKRPILFIMERSEFHFSPWKALMRAAGVLAVDLGNKTEMNTAIDRAGFILANGGLVCVFPERYISRTGYLNAFYDFFHPLVHGDVPVLPLFIDRIRGSRNKVQGKESIDLETVSWRHVTIVTGKPIPANVPLSSLRSAIEELSAEAYGLRKKYRNSLGWLAIRKARRNWFRPVVADTTGKRLNGAAMLISSLVLVRLLKKQMKDDRMTGVLLPASAGASLVNLALTVLEKIPVNLNFTCSPDAITDAIKVCGIRTVITSRQFLSRLQGVSIPARTLYIEDLVRSVTILDKLIATITALFVPARFMTHERRYDTNTCATIVFSSGSTSEPKGIVLTHHNIISNIEQMHSVIDLSKEDCMCASLPFFHSFGLTATMWFPLIAGFRVMYHPNPLDGAKIASIVREEHGTILLATPTFLQVYLRKAQAEDFRSLRLVISGAEKLRTSLSDEFERKFGIKPLEGYGATELSPVAALNVPDVTRWQRREQGCRTGTIGRLLPGMCARIVDPDTHEPVKDNEAGLLLLKGPNIMKGYLNRIDETKAVVREGWYVTGDIAKISSDGFVTLTDRLTRFSKIGGEMVPHGAIEEILSNALGITEPVLAVASAPHQHRGEQVVVLYTKEAGTPEKLKEIMEKAPVPNLWKPSDNAYILIDAIPVLGTGKTDLKKLKALACLYINENRNGHESPEFPAAGSLN